MKLIYGLLILIFFQNCSFDTKTNIWKNSNNTASKKENLFKDFKDLSTSDKLFNKNIIINEDFKFKFPQPTFNNTWQDIFYSESNNLKNFKYDGLNNVLFKSKKLSKFKINNYILFNKDILILTDEKGNIIIFSINQNKVLKKFNFYKKKYKKVKKLLNIISENNIIYVSDNIGYLYAYDYLEDKILWAQYYKIPFRSNLKVTKHKIITSDQNNKLIFVDKENGNNLKEILTEETLIKNSFINNLSLNNEAVYFLNTYGSLYSINIKNMDINWILNLNPSLDISASSLFFANKIVFKDNNIVISSNKSTYIIDSKTGVLNYIKNFSSSLQPIIISNYLFLITVNDFLIAMNLTNGKIIYSYDVNKKISDFLDTKKQKVQIKNFVILNNEIYVFLENSYIVKFNTRGDIEKIYKLPLGIHSYPIFVNGIILYIDKKNKAVLIN